MGEISAPLIMRSHWEMPTAYHRVFISVIFDFTVTCDTSLEYSRIYNPTWSHSLQVLFQELYGISS